MNFLHKCINLKAINKEELGFVQGICKPWCHFIRVYRMSFILQFPWVEELISIQMTVLLLLNWLSYIVAQMFPRTRPSCMTNYWDNRENYMKTRRKDVVSQIYVTCVQAP